ncbi:SNF2 family N-terminal domain-containing protein [Zopfochytrium polystomum]|nr:SNF2 family N-terminal domain-containing protein [Zopfochytrium polystomum]
MQSAPPSSEPPTSTVRRSSQASSARSSEPPPNPPLTPSTPPVFSRFNGLTGFLSSFVWIEDELISANDDELERRAEDEAVLSQRIQEFQRRGLLGDRSKSSSTTLAQQTAPTLPGASSSTSFGLEPLDEAATHWSRLHEEIRLASNSASQHRRMKLSNGKKISKAVQRYWELKKTEGERLARLEEKRLRKLAKAVSAEVAKKWKVVDAIVKGKQKELYRREQERAGKRQLQAILNQSTHILTTVASSSQLISQSASPTQVNSEDPALSDFDSIDARDAEDGGDFDESDYMDDDIDDDEDAESDDEDSSDDTPLHQLLGYTDEGIPADTTQEHPPSPLYQDERQGENMNDSSSESEDESDDDDDVIEVLPNRPSAFPSKPKEQESATPPNGRPKSKDDVPKVGATPVEAKKVSNPDVPEVPAIVNGVDAQTAIGDAAATEKKPLEASLEHSSTAMNHNHIEDEMMHDPAEKAEQAILPSTPTIPKVRASDSVDPSVSEDMDQYEPASQDSDSSPRARDLIEAPTGNTLTTTNVRVKVPFLLRHSLREYQHVGLDWLAKLYNNGLNGILADEMGLGKTIQTIALIAYLAVEKGIWGPHLIVVPTSVMLNWEFEFKKWCPGLKILTYYGSQTQRREKRTGWSKPNAFHVCITSYQLVLTDQVMLKRRPWHYLILDEAHNIKNFRSQRWQVLLNFSSQRRLLLTGTPLQNNLMELWSLMYFLMPNGVSSAMPTGFATLKDFQEWFARPVEHLVEGAGGDAGNEVRETVAKLHTVLRPYLLRRLKRDVEKQMPGKFEHVVYCKLSLRQRFLYDDYMSRAKTKEDLASGNYMSIINCLMQLRKVCNHPDLFEVRPIVTSFAMYGSAVDQFEPAYSMLDRLLQFKQDHTSNPWPPFAGSLDLDLSSWNLLVTDPRVERYSMMATLLINRLDPDQHFDETVVGIAQSEMALRAHFAQMMGGTNNGPPLSANYSNINEHANLLRLRQASQTTIRWFRMRVANRIRCQIHPLYGAGIIYVIKTLGRRPIDSFHPTLPSYTDAFEPIRKARSRRHWNARLSQEIIADLVPTLSIRLAGDLGNLIDRFAFVTPRARVVQRWGGAPIGPPAGLWSKRAPVEEARLALEKLLGVTPGPPSRRRAQPVAEKFTDVLHAPHNRLTIAFPDRWLLQYDCGKLQVLAVILRRLKQGGHRALIFTQMTRVLDVLEQFLNLHGYIYLRLDGATKIEERKILMDRFNNDSRNFVFILSTRSGGVGMNLTGADTVIFYDSDWNPAMDAQAQDRAHRIGQTRDVHIYRLISKHTIEENMLRKADEKRRLDSVVIQEGEFTVDHLKKMDWRDWLDDDMTRMLPMSSSSAAFPVRDTISMEDLPAPVAANPISRSVASWEEAMMAVEDEPDVRAMQSARTEMAAELHEFDETGSTSLGPPVTATPSALVNPSQNIASADMPPPPPPPVTVAGGESAVVDVAGRDASNNDVPTTRTTAIGPSAGTGREADDGEVGHVDDYMIRFWVWNLGLPASFVELLHEPT